MTCNRCEDIHYAQKEGTQLESCKCECHNEKPNTDWMQKNNVNEAWWDNNQLLCESCGSNHITYINPPEDLGEPTAIPPVKEGSIEHNYNKIMGVDCDSGCGFCLNEIKTRLPSTSATIKEG